MSRKSQEGFQEEETRRPRDNDPFEDDHVKKFKGWSRVGGSNGGQRRPGPAHEGLCEGVQS